MYNQVVVIGVQILLVPILLHGWGIERYGVWLLLSSIPTYLTFSDFGFTFIAKNEMTMKVAGGTSMARSSPIKVSLCCSISLPSLSPFQPPPRFLRFP
jgi:hypothetical protein